MSGTPWQASTVFTPRSGTGLTEDPNTLIRMNPSPSGPGLAWGPAGAGADAAGHCVDTGISSSMTVAPPSAAHAELEAAKYRHPFCQTCMGHGLSYSVRDAARVG